MREEFSLYLVISDTLSEQALIRIFHYKEGNISCWPGGWGKWGGWQPPARPRPPPPPGCAVGWSYLAWSSSGFLSRSAASWFLAEFYSHSNWKPAVLMFSKTWNIILQNKTHSFFAFPFSTNERLSLDIILLIFQRTLTWLFNGRKTLTAVSEGKQASDIDELYYGSFYGAILQATLNLAIHLLFACLWSIILVKMIVILW